MSKFLLSAIVLLALIFYSTLGPVDAGILSDIQDGIEAGKGLVEAATCDIPQGEIDACNRVTGLLYTANQADQVKRECCSFLATRDCIHAAARIHCGKNAAKFVNFGLNLGKDLTVVCMKYDNALDCMNPLVVLVAAVLGIILVVACLKACCCSSSSKRARIVASAPIIIKTDGQAPLLANEAGVGMGYPHH